MYKAKYAIQDIANLGYIKQFSPNFINKLLTGIKGRNINSSNNPKLLILKYLTKRKKVPIIRQIIIFLEVGLKNSFINSYYINTFIVSLIKIKIKFGIQSESSTPILFLCVLC